ncbi:TPR-like protein [Gymnopus androsaceus JB14]|uniref:ER membrane protein complex subunit 2 n=1 Tax=Gymnopus androsaceus JB14 TaxID=1447944 RepID=A0A6A4HCF4_9AGAR|nr:TPR-like protein [Gymnopus androsaceus JB14]
MSLSSALETLANYRTHNTRASQDIVEKGRLLLKSNVASKMGDDAWAFLEQLALASVDIARYDVADECLRQLLAKFPESPRVDVLSGIRMEATEPPEVVLKFYDQLLEADSSNAAIYKRRISVLVRMGKTEQAVSELCEYLDTFYSDVEGWVELAELYSSCNQYTSALQALSHALLLAPQNPFYVLQFAETAYTAEDIPLAIKMFMLTIDIADRHASEESIPSGASVRAWYGVKLCCRALSERSSLSSPSDTPLPKNLNLLDELATERVLTAYSAATGKGERLDESLC